MGASAPTTMTFRVAALTLGLSCLLAALASFTSAHGNHRCAVDDEVYEPSWSAQDYEVHVGDMDQHRRLSTFSGIRIHPVYLDLAADAEMSVDEADYLEYTLFPAVISWFNNVLKVNPVSGPLAFDRDCEINYLESGKCKQAFLPSTCGSFEVPVSLSPCMSDHT